MGDRCPLARLQEGTSLSGHRELSVEGEEVWQNEFSDKRGCEINETGRGFSPSNLRKRLLTAFIAIPGILALVWLGGIPFLAFIGVVAVLGFLEISRLMEKKGVWISRPFGIFSVILILSGAFLDREFGTFLAFVVSFIFILLIRLSRNVESALQDAAMMALGIFYTGGLASFAVLLREYPGNMS